MHLSRSRRTDPLSDLLRVVRLNGAFFYTVDAVEPWSVDTVPADQLSPRILPGADHLISYHILTAGSCMAGLVGAEPITLTAGDVIVFPHGDAHVMSGGDAGRGAARLHYRTPARYGETVFLGDRRPGSRGATFICGFLGCDRLPFNPLLATLPRQLHMRGPARDWLKMFTHRVKEESRHARAGADAVVTRLAEVMFIEVLRRYLEHLPATQTGWLAGLRDATVGRALTLLHGRPGHRWTLAELARESGSSRSSVAKRFQMLVGRPPMQYLAQWRMQVAGHQLTQSDAKVATIAARVGYDSEAAFSRAFKKAAGLAPGAWRASRRAGRIVSDDT